MFEKILPAEVKRKIDNLFYYANDLLIQKVERYDIFQKSQIQNNESIILDLGRTILTTFEIKQLARLLIKRLPKIGFPVCFLFLFDDHTNFKSTAQTVLAYNQQEIFKLQDHHFQLSEMIPQEYLERDQIYYYDILPLHFQSNILGYIVLGEKKEIYGGEVYEVIRSQISTAIQGALLIKDLKKTEKELEILLKSMEIENIELEQKVQGRTIEIQAINKEILSAYEEANNANQAKSIFLANMSHEIRTPLNSIIGFSEIIKELENKEDINHHLDLMIIESYKLLELINQLLDLSKIESGKLELNLEYFNLFDLVEKITSVFHAKAVAKGLELKIEQDNTMPHELKGDPLRIYQILSNFIDNAIKFTKKGTIIVKINKLKESKDRIVLQFEVKDTGVGIPKDRQVMIFEPFIQADESTTRNFGGTGLGTTISKQLVEMMDGEIGLESTSGVGSIFWFKIELDKPRTNNKSKKEHNEVQSEEIKINPDQYKSKKILLVEDYSVTRKIAIHHLSKLGCTIDQAENGKIAVGKCNKKEYDLILMDVQMPIMDGIKATSVIRKIDAKNKPHILGMTANAFETDVKKYHKAGMDDVITKPFRKNELMSKVIHWLSI